MIYTTDSTVSYLYILTLCVISAYFLSIIFSDHQKEFLSNIIVMKE